MSRRWISVPLGEGDCSRQTYCDFPPDANGHEIGREGFFGLSAHLHPIEHDEASTPLRKFGDRVRIEMFDAAGPSIFGTIDQEVARNEH